MTTEIWVNIDSGNEWLVAWQHQAITWTKVDLPSVRSIGIHLSTISQEILQPSVTKISWKISFLKSLWILPEANELSNKFAQLTRSWGRFKNTYELLNLRALKFSHLNKIHIFQCMGKIFCVEFQRYPLKFHTKYLTHTLKNMIFKQHWNFKSS